VVTNSVAELKKNVVPDCAAVKVEAAVRVVTDAKPVIEPVTLPVKLPIKPFVDVTGPEKVVEAILNSSHASIKVKCLSA
jgi:hypothetical protein